MTLFPRRAGSPRVTQASSPRNRMRKGHPVFPSVPIRVKSLPSEISNLRLAHKKLVQQNRLTSSGHSLYNPPGNETE